MSQRWNEKETKALGEMRRLLKDDLARRPQYPDVVGDRRLLRFLRGKQNNVAEAAKMFKAFLKWRDDNNIDAIRNEILYGGMDSAFKFPKGKEILDLAPQIIISANAQDYKGQPLVLEQYSFCPCEMFSRITVKDYLLFIVYASEFRALVTEQMSHEREQQYLKENPNPVDGYGVVVLTMCIRDLYGVGLSHVTGKGKQIIEGAINIDLPYYPEFLGKCHMINVPWVFASIWFFIKGLLDEVKLSRINLMGPKFMSSLLKDMPIESIPKALGGKFELYNESYSFDTSPTGPFYTEPVEALPCDVSVDVKSGACVPAAAALKVSQSLKVAPTTVTAAVPLVHAPNVVAVVAVGRESDHGIYTVAVPRQPHRRSGHDLRAPFTTAHVVRSNTAVTKKAEHVEEDETVHKPSRMSSIQESGSSDVTVKPAAALTYASFASSPAGLAVIVLMVLAVLAYLIPSVQYAILPVSVALFVACNLDN